MSDAVVMGINSVYHDSSACVLAGSDVRAMVEEERLSRVKHAKPARVDNADVLPELSIRWCLDTAGVRAEDVDFFALSYDPDLRTRVDEPFIEGDWSSPTGEAIFLEKTRSIPARLSELLGVDVTERVVWVPHHVSHASSAYFASSYDDAAILSIDGIGEAATVLLARGRGLDVEPLGEVLYPHSLGFVWERCSAFVGLGLNHAGKMMALAGFGDPQFFANEFEKLVKLTPDGFTVDTDYVAFRANRDRLDELFGPPRRRDEDVSARDAHVAAALQATTERVFVHLASILERKTGLSKLCMAGGVALNCIGIDAIARETSFKDIFVQPAAYDAGTALGAALYVAHTRGGVQSRYVMRHPYLGPRFGDADIEAALRDSGVAFERSGDAPAEAARRIAAGQVVGWFQGATEVGPRALGNRSILADPRTPSSKELINLLVKHREYFRPFAPSVLEEHAFEWFHVPVRSISLGFMSFACAAQADKAAHIPAVLHVDGTSRLQVVGRELNPRYHRLISEFHALTGVPVVVNTSFNGPTEPIVNTPADALRTFRTSSMDALVLGDYVVERRERRVRATYS